MSISNFKNTAYLGLGSNLTDRLAKLLEAENRLNHHPQIEIQKKSPIYETEPWPKHSTSHGRTVEEGVQNWHLNQVIQISTSLSPHELLAELQSIEKAMGKVQKAAWGSREIDLDILLYNDLILDSEELILPHPHMHERAFVLQPLVDIAPKLLDPRSGKAFKVFLEGLDDPCEIRPYA